MAVSRLVRQFPKLAPENGTAEAFVAWLQANGSTGDHLQGDLHDAYNLLCKASGYSLIPHKQFGREMKRAGCGRRKIDISDGGIRSMPYVLTVPDVSGPEGNVTGLQVVGWETTKGPSRKRTARVKRAETKRKLVASM